MFTGIVQDQVTIQHIQTTPTGLTIAFSLPKWGSPQIGESILLHGICSTVTTVSDDHFTVDYIVETIRVTTVSDWIVGQTIHAEPAATLMTKLSGSLVTGHVDQAAIITAIDPLTIQLSDDLIVYMFSKGSVTINGVNLTIIECSTNTIIVKLIPQTLKLTGLGTLQVGGRVNVEADYIVKAAQAALAARRV